MYDELILISESESFDENGNPLTDDLGRLLPKNENKRKISVTVESVGQGEFFKANTYGVKPEYKLKTFCGNYKNETDVIFRKEKYKIYRTFLKGEDEIELYLTKRLGDINEY